MRIPALHRLLALSSTLLLAGSAIGCAGPEGDPLLTTWTVDYLQVPP